MATYYDGKAYETIDETDMTWKDKLKWKADRALMHIENFGAWAIQNPYLSVPLTIVTANFVNGALNRRHELKLEREKNRRLNEQLRYNREAMEYDRERRGSYK